MIDFGVSLPELVAGMARSVRERILPHLDDPSARIQAEELASLLDLLARAFSEGSESPEDRAYFEAMTSKESSARRKE